MSRVHADVAAVGHETGLENLNLLEATGLAGIDADLFKDDESDDEPEPDSQTGLELAQDVAQPTGELSITTSQKDVFCLADLDPLGSPNYQDHSVADPAG